MSTRSENVLKISSPQQSSERSRKALLVLGMHRSGTSSITGVLSLLGAELPANLLPAVEGNNERGFWESADLMEIHNNILKSVGMTWSDVGAFPRGWEKSAPAAAYRKQILDFLEKNFSDSPLFVIKDPRICRLLPLWLDLLKEFGADPLAVIPIRNPMEVAASLKARDSIVPAVSQILWLRHVLEAERHTRNIPRSFISYEGLISDWRSEVNKIATDLGISWSDDSHRSAVKVENFLSGSLRHHKFESAQLAARSDISKWVSTTYGAIEGLQNPNKDQQQRVDFSLDLLDTTAEDIDAADCIFGPILAKDKMVIADLRGALNDRQIKLDKLNLERESMENELNAVREDLNAKNLLVESNRLEIEKEKESKLGDIKRLEDQLKTSNLQLIDREERETEWIEWIEKLELNSHSLSTELEEAERLKLQALEELSLTLQQHEETSSERNMELAKAKQDLVRAEQSLTENRERNESLIEHCSLLAQTIKTLAAEKTTLTESVQARFLEIAKISQLLHEANSDMRLLKTEQEGLLQTNSMLRKENSLLVEELSRSKAESLKTSVLLKKSQAEKERQVEKLSNLWQEIRIANHALKKIESSFAYRIGHPIRMLHLAKTVKLVKKSGLFNPDWYLEKYPDVAKEEMDPLIHFVLHGGVELRDPSPNFNSRCYVDKYPDVGIAGVSPLIHYIKHGRKENREISASTL